jgi:hypothetical protein
MGCATKYSDRPYKQASPFCLRILAFDLICRYDVDLWLSVTNKGRMPIAKYYIVNLYRLL